MHDGHQPPEHRISAQNRRLRARQPQPEDRNGACQPFRSVTDLPDTRGWSLDCLVGRLGIDHALWCGPSAAIGGL
jgi:hypothetical protein